MKNLGWLSLYILLVAFTALCLPYAVWFGLRISPPMALLIALAASLVAVWLPVLLRHLRDLREFS